MAIAYQIKSRVEMSGARAALFRASYHKQTNKQTQNIAKYGQVWVFEKICFREVDRGFLVLNDH